MRRLASPLALCGLALLTACGGSGLSSGSSTDSLDQIVFSASFNGQASDFFVAPNGSNPLRVDALGQRGSGPAAIVVPDATFTWAARFVNPATDGALGQYQVGPAPLTPKQCGTPSQTPPITLYQQSLSSLAGPFPGYVALPSGQAARTVFIGGVSGVTALPYPAPPAVATSSPSYCIVLQATHVGGAEIGSHVVVVSNAP
ncbi:MAG: hypothetical protein NVS2B3_16020 [Vulcanimicrobiaceae bacterium]